MEKKIDSSVEIQSLRFIGSVMTSNLQLKILLHIDSFTTTDLNGTMYMSQINAQIHSGYIHLGLKSYNIQQLYKGLPSRFN